jgi:hypothetical protein
VGGDQLQPGVEDGGTPTEVVAAVELRNTDIPQNRKTENPPKKKKKKKNQK